MGTKQCFHSTAGCMSPHQKNDDQNCWNPPMVPDSGRYKVLAETVSCCRTCCQCLRSGRNRAWKVGLQAHLTMCGCYLPQSHPRGSPALPCGVAYVSCQPSEDPQSWTELLGSALPASASPWALPACSSLELGSLVLAGGFGLLNQAATFCAPSLS